MNGKLDTVREALDYARRFSDNLGIEYRCNAALSALSAIDPEAARPSEDTEKLCHQIYDVLPISPALKLLDDGKLYALITAHDEAIRREALQSVRKEIEEWRDDITCWDYDEGYLDGTENALKIIDAAILSAEPAQDDGKADDKRRIVAWVYPSGEWRIECSSPYAWKERGAFEVIPVMTVAEVKRRIEEAKE